MSRPGRPKGSKNKPKPGTITKAPTSKTGSKSGSKRGRPRKSEEAIIVSLNYRPPQDEEEDDVSDDDHDEMFRNDVPRDSNCHRCSKYKASNKTLRERLLKYKGPSNQLIIHDVNLAVSKIIRRRIRNKKTDICCWNDCHPINGSPYFLPDDDPEAEYDDGVPVIGVFCGFECMMSYNMHYLRDSKVAQRISWLYSLYRRMYDIPYGTDITINPAPPKELTIMFGGEMTIKAYRTKSKHQRKFVPYPYPVRPVNPVVEEKSDDEEVRPRPRPKGRGSVIASLRKR